MSILDSLKSLADEKVAKINKGYLPGCMDEFLGIRMPMVRKVSKKYEDLSLDQIQTLLDSKYHEIKLAGLVILGGQVEKEIKRATKNNEDSSEKLLDVRAFYLKNLDKINSWDLVDVSAYKVLGNILIFGSKTDGSLELYKKSNPPFYGYITLDVLSNSEYMWAKRVAIISMFSFLWEGDVVVPLGICQFHIKNHHHYIQKAVGWILREVGKRDMVLLNNFLKVNINKIGSICLSYALEKHSKEDRKRVRSLRKRA